MNHPRRIDFLRLALAGAALTMWFSLGVARAQDTTTTSTTAGHPTVTTEVKSATVVYVSGNELVARTDDGTIKHFVVPNDKTVTVDGKQLTVHDLQPGMRLTRTITTSSTPKTVQTVRTIKGKVWYVNPPHNLILSLPEGNKQYTVPDGTMFEVDGQKQSIFHVKKGMLISATIIRDSPEVEVTSNRAVSGEAAPAPPPPPPTPAVQGVLLIEEVAPAPQQVAQATLPKTGSPIPLIGFLGLLFIGASVGLRKIRT